MESSEWIIECLATFLQAKMKEEMPGSFPVVAMQVTTDRFCDWEIILFHLHYVTFQNQKPKNCETFFDLLHIQGRPTRKNIRKSISSLLERNNVDISNCRPHAYNGVDISNCRPHTYNGTSAMSEQCFLNGRFSQILA